MDEVTRKAVEERAYALWEEAGRPEGSGLLYWLRAEQELGIIPKIEEPDPLVTLQELAVAAQEERQANAAKSEDQLQASVDAAVPHAERLPSGAEENPLSEHVAQIAKEGVAPPGRSTLEGGDQVPR